MQNWHSRLERHVLITLPQETSLDRTNTSSPALSSQETLLQILHSDPRGHDIRIMTDTEIRQLLAHWGSSWTTTLPSVINLTYDGDKQTLENLVKQKLPQAVIVFPSDTTQWLSSIIHPIQLASSMVSLFLILTGETLFFLAVLLSLSCGWEKHLVTLKTLFYSGCPESLFRQSLRRQIGWRCLIGGYSGLVIMVPLLNIMTSILQPVFHLPPQPADMNHIFFHNPFGPLLTVILLLWPVLNCLAGWGLAAFFFRHPSRHFYA